MQSIITNRSYTCRYSSYLGVALVLGSKSSPVERITGFLAQGKYNSVVLCPAPNGHKCCILRTLGHWNVPNFPQDHMRDSLFDCSGYGATYEEAITEAMKWLPG
jgi:hypothetical protein